MPQDTPPLAPSPLQVAIDDARSRDPRAFAAGVRLAALRLRFSSGWRTPHEAAEALDHLAAQIETEA